MIKLMQSIIWVMVSYLSGALPFSFWLGKIILGKDIRDYGDGNPGATNVFRAGSPVLGVVCLLLDVAKAALPVGICYFNLGFRGIPMLLIATAPLLGHMFSPFLKFTGGKALAASLGVWIGLTLWQASVPAVVGVIIGILILSSSGWAAMFAMLVILITLLVFLPNSLFLGIWLLQTLILGWTHRQDLAERPELSPRMKKLFQRGGS